MKDDEYQDQQVNIVVVPVEKMDAVLEALKPILGHPGPTTGDKQEGVFADWPGIGTGCTRTNLHGSSDFSCTDQMV
ncbi:MAG: hypothetical protein WBP94_08965 [Rhodomicrobiaceae bacterium]